MRSIFSDEKKLCMAAFCAFERSTGPGGSLYVGSPETVAGKIATTARALGLSRFDMKYSHGTLPHRALVRSVELYGTQVIPRVRELLSDD